MAIAALIVSIIALGVAIATAGYNKRNAEAAEGSKEAADRSADAAKDSARHAESSAESAAAMVRTELERDHEARAPEHNGNFEYIHWSPGPEIRNLIYLFRLDRPYVVQAEVSRENGRVTSARAMNGHFEDGLFRIDIDAWPEGLQERVWEQLTIRFWPPRTDDEGHVPWSCACGRPQSPEEKRPHWEWSIIVKPPRKSRASF